MKWATAFFGVLQVLAVIPDDAKMELIEWMLRRKGNRCPVCGQCLECEERAAAKESST